jgi:hypothetical protein
MSKLRQRGAKESSPPDTDNTPVDDANTTVAATTDDDDDNDALDTDHNRGGPPTTTTAKPKLMPGSKKLNKAFEKLSPEMRAYFEKRKERLLAATNGNICACEYELSFVCGVTPPRARATLSHRPAGLHNPLSSLHRCSHPYCSCCTFSRINAKSRLLNKTITDASDDDLGGQAGMRMSTKLDIFIVCFIVCASCERSLLLL